MNYLVIIRIIGLVLVSLAATMLSAVAVAWFYGETGSVMAYLVAMGVTLLTGGLMVLAGRGAGDTIYRREALAIVTLSWLVGGWFGGLGLRFDGAVPTLTDGFFETISGLTTTGSSVITDLDVVSHASKWWRGMTNWLGGLGIIALFVAIFPQLGVGGKFLFQSEVAGPINEGLKPKIRETSAILWRIYILITLIGISALMLAGVDWFDSSVHTFAAIATGGFGNYNNSVNGLANPAAEYILIMIMLTGGINFGLFYYVFKGKRNALFSNPEFHWYLGFVLISTLAITVTVFTTWSGLEKAFRDSLFTVVSIMTTTGFATADYEQWHGFSQLVLALLMIVGGMAGSTGGGVKVIRVMLAVKLMIQELYSEFRPQMVRVIRTGSQIITTETGRSVAVFFLIALVSFWVNVLFLAAMGVDMATSLGATIACMFNIGPGFGLVGPTENYAAMPALVKVSLSLMMILGRLEFVTVLALLVPDFWRR